MTRGSDEGFWVHGMFLIALLPSSQKFTVLGTDNLGGFSESMF